MAPREPAAAGGARVRPLPGVSPLVFGQRLVPREGGAALVADVLLRLDVDVLLVLLHVAQLGEAFAAHGAQVRLLAGVDQRVHVQILAGKEALPAADAFKGPLSGVTPHVSLQPFRAREAALAERTTERLLPRVSAQVSPQLGGLEETHAAVGAAVRLLRLLLVRLLVLAAVARLRETLPADGAGEGLLSRVHPNVTHEFVEFAEGLHAVRALVGHLGLLGVRALVPL